MIITNILEKRIEGIEAQDLGKLVESNEQLKQWIADQKAAGYSLDAVEATYNTKRPHIAIVLINESTRGCGLAMGIAARKGRENNFYFLSGIAGDEISQICEQLGIDKF